MAFNYKLLAIPGLLMLLRKKGKAPSRMQPTVDPKVPAKDGKAPAAGTGKSPSQDAVTAFMREQITKYGKAECWSSSSQKILQEAKALLATDPDKAFALLRTLPEDQRKAFAKLIYGEIKHLSWPEIAGIVGWYYINFGGADAASIKKGQVGVPPFSRGLNVPETGILDAATKASIEEKSQLLFWKPTLRHWKIT